MKPIYKWAQVTRNSHALNAKKEISQQIQLYTRT
jgi:hypothetical protein